MSVVQDPNVWAIPERHETVVELEDHAPVWYVVMRGHRDDGSFGAIGVVWVTETSTAGGFIAAPSAGWLGDEMRRSYDGARERGWDANRIFRYWSDEDGEHTGLSLDPPARASDLIAVRRIVANG